MNLLNEQDCPCPHPQCGHSMNKDGFTRTRRQRYECPDCGTKISVPQPIPINDFGAYLRDVREQHRLTQQHVSERLGHGRSWLSRIEAGSRGISLDELFQLAQLYQLRPSELLAGYEKQLY